jgi:hypothetical protein
MPASRNSSNLLLIKALLSDSKPSVISTTMIFLDSLDFFKSLMPAFYFFVNFMYLHGGLLTLTWKLGSIFCHCLTCFSACLKTQSPVLATSPVSSATGINSPGLISLSSGCDQRARTSVFVIRPVCSSIIGSDLVKGEAKTLTTM